MSLDTCPKCGSAAVTTASENEGKRFACGRLDGESSLRCDECGDKCDDVKQGDACLSANYALNPIDGICSGHYVSGPASSADTCR